MYFFGRIYDLIRSAIGWVFFLSVSSTFLTLDPKPGQILRMEVGLLPLVFFDKFVLVWVNFVCDLDDECCVDLS